MPTKILKPARKQRVVHSNPEILGGSPAFVGTRVHVKTLFDYLADGRTTVVGIPILVEKPKTATPVGKPASANHDHDAPQKR